MAENHVCEGEYTDSGQEAVHAQADPGKSKMHDDQRYRAENTLRNELK